MKDQLYYWNIFGGIKMESSIPVNSMACNSSSYSNSIACYSYSNSGIGLELQSIPILINESYNYINPGYGLSLVDTLWNASSYRQPLEQEGNPMT